jgi:hypothetical protein
MVNLTKKLYFTKHETNPTSYTCIKEVTLENKIYTAAELIALEPAESWNGVTVVMENWSVLHFLPTEYPTKALPMINT